MASFIPVLDLFYRNGCCVWSLVGCIWLILRNAFNLTVPSGEIGSAWEWYYWIGLERTSIAIGFLFFIFDLEYFIRVPISEPLPAKMNPTSCLFGLLFSTLHELKPWSFPRNHAPKMRESHQLFFGLGHMSKKFEHPAIQTKIEQHFGGFFHQIKVRQPIRRQDSMQTVIRTRRRLDSILHEAAQDFEVFSNIQDSNKKIKNL
jgi:hypothetical protein